MLPSTPSQTTPFGATSPAGSIAPDRLSDRHNLTWGHRLQSVKDGLYKWRPAKSSHDPGEQRLFGFPQSLDRHFLCDRGELSQEFAQRMAVIQVVDEILERNASASKAGRAAHDVPVAYDRLFCHGLS